MIVESTYGTQHHGPREVRERNFLDKVVNTVKKGGRVLIPIVAIGRAQVSCCAREGGLGGGAMACWGWFRGWELWCVCRAGRDWVCRLACTAEWCRWLRTQCAAVMPHMAGVVVPAMVWVVLVFQPSVVSAL